MEWKSQPQKVSQNETAEEYVPDEGRRRKKKKTRRTTKLVEIGNLHEKEFKVTIVKMIQNLRKRMEAQIESIQEMLRKT